MSGPAAKSMGRPIERPNQRESVCSGTRFAFDAALFPRYRNKSGLKRQGRGNLPRPSRWKASCSYGQGPGPGVESKKPETVPLNCEDVVIVPVVLTTTTKSD